MQRVAKAERQLIVVLPRIGGSVLARPGKPKDVVWDAGKADWADLIFRPDRMSVQEAPHLEPQGLTESTKFMGFTVVPGYEKLLEQLEIFGKIDRHGDPQDAMPDADIVAVPYDFRRGIMAAAERLDAVVCAHLITASETERHKRVTIVAHSMGGLVARVWLGVLGRWRWCRTLITLGTPHRGAPKALQRLVNGIPGRPKTTAMLRGWESMAQLLPRYPAIRDLAAADKNAPGAALYPHELPIPWLATPAKEAYDLHALIEQRCGDIPRRGPTTVACIGWSHPTLSAAFWDAGRLRVTKDHPDWLGLDGWERDFGDGTVPSFSALPPEMDDDEHSPEWLVQRHVPLAHAQIVTDLLNRPRLKSPPTQAHGPQDSQRPPAIGLDLDELYATGTPIRITATLREVDTDLSKQVVKARLRPVRSRAAEQPGQVNTPLSWDDAQGCFTGELPDQPPGLYEVRVSAREVPRAGDLVAADTVAVVEDE